MCGGVMLDFKAQVFQPVIYGVRVI